MARARSSRQNEWRFFPRRRPVTSLGRSTCCGTPYSFLQLNNIFPLDLLLFLLLGSKISTVKLRETFFWGGGGGVFTPKSPHCLTSGMICRLLFCQVKKQDLKTILPSFIFGPAVSKKRNGSQISP